MTNQPRMGDRVRITIEGATVDDFTGMLGQKVQVSHGRYGSSDIYWPADDVTVEILERAKPPEPTGLGAVVRATLPSGAADLWVRVDHGGRAPWREVLSGAYDEDDACRRSWDQITGTIEIVSPGVAEATP